MTGIYIFLLMLILPIIAQINVTSTFNKYSKVRSSRGLTADQVARQILDSNGLYNVRIERVSGKLSDHYDPRDNVVRLSDSTYGNSSVAAIGVAAHAENYGPIVLRSKLVPITNFCSRFWYFTFILGLIFSELSIGTTLVYASIIMFAAVIVFQLVTLPTEFDASSRALATFENNNLLEASEVPQAKKVLTAAALTYVTGLVVSLLQLLRLLSASRRR